MKLLIELVPLALLAGVVWLVVQRTRLTAAERAELNNLRLFKETVRSAAMDEAAIDATTPLARALIDEVAQVDRANSAVATRSSRKETR